MGATEKKKYNQQYDQFTNQLNGQVAGQTGQGQAYGDMTRDALTKYDSAAYSNIDPGAVGRQRGMGEAGMAGYAGMVGGLYNNPGYSGGEQRQMRLGVTAPVSAAFRTGQAQMGRNGAATGNMGAANAHISEMAREKSRTMGGMLSGLYGQFGDARRQDQQFATQAQGQIPGMATGMMGQEAQQLANAQPIAQTIAGQQANANQLAQGYMGQKGQLLDQQKQLAQQPGFWSQLAMAGMSGAGAALSGPLGNIGKAKQAAV